MAYYRRSIYLILFACLLWPISPLAAQAAEDPLVLGIFPRLGSTATIRMFKPLSEHLSKELGREVILETAKDFEAFWKNVSTQRYDIVHYNQYDYVKSHKQGGYRAILKNEEFGADTMSGTLYVRKDSGIDSVQDLRGKKIVFGGGPTAMMSYIVPTYMLRKAGLQESDYETNYAISPPNAIYAAYYGHAAAVGSGSIALDLPTVRKKIDVSRLKPLTHSQDIAHLPWAIKKDMPADLQLRIQTILAGLKSTEQGKVVLQEAGLTNLIVAKDEDYDEHRNIINMVLGEDYCVRNCDSKRVAVSDKSVKKGLTMGIFPRRSQKLTMKLFQPMAVWLEKELGQPVNLVAPKTFKEFWRGIKERRYDITHYNQFHYVKSHKLYGYNIILKNEERNKTTLTPTLWVRKDSGINSISDLKGKKIIFGGGKMAMLAYVGPTYLLRQAGLNKGDYEENLAINPLDGCKAMYLGQAAACGAGTIMMHLPSVKKVIDINDVVHLKTTDPLTHLSWAVKDEMDPQLSLKIKTLLSELYKTPGGKEVLKSARVNKLHVSIDSDYDVHREMIRAVTGEVF